MQKFELLPGEQLLWAGKPEGFRMLDIGTAKQLLRDLLVCLLGGVFILLEIWLLSDRKFLPSVSVLLVILLMLVPVMHLILDAVKLRKTEYAATDRRLLVINSIVKDVAFSRIGEAGIKTDPAGHRSLLCGKKALSASPASYRERTVLGLDALDGDDTPCESFAFYAVSDPESLKSALSPYLPLV